MIVTKTRTKTSSSGRRICCLYQVRQMPYPDAWQWQQQLLRERILNPDGPETLILLEHPPVYTLGTGSSLSHVKFDPKTDAYDLYRTERGGEVTYHCPGQLVGYPILNLRHFQTDLHWYLRQLEEVIILTLSQYGLVGERLPGLTGVWVAGRKVAAIGIKVSRWITMHGFALNVNPDLTGFERIVPCGLVNRPVGSMADWLPNLDCQEVKTCLAQSFAKIFEVKYQEAVRHPEG
jgi:lipoyl(octanoyl) transferase